MTLGRQHVLGALIAAVLIAAGVWLVLHTEWVEVEVPDPLKGPALTDPDHRLKQLATRLGAQVSAPGNLDQLPPSGATLVLSSRHWALFPERAQRLERWVRDGGHLWLPYSGAMDDALAWVPVEWVRIPYTDTEEEAAEREADAPDADAPPAPARQPRPAAKPRCSGLAEAPQGTPAFGTARRFDSCVFAAETLRAGVPVQWALSGPRGPVVARVPVGQGSVTVTSAVMPWGNTQLLSRDNALLAAATLRLQPGQTLWFVRDEARAPLLSFLWTAGAPALLLGALALALGLWRGAVRFGPRHAAPASARRSIAEQIRGSAQFIARHGAGALHDAQRRALTETARTRIQGFEALTPAQRAQAIARVTALDAAALVRAMDPAAPAPSGRHAGALLALLETARRRLLHTAAFPSPR